ncbi:Lysosomal cystine transporter [Parasponia andersonii]|uniref:Lysosomal cystine transporter n=1 Tax=Parasponia andersonii TaxID=3476 RepID=A0A2P5B5I8_PARAD|nr:Lysosomal cystine transporter [Parasponia andersonii]
MIPVAASDVAFSVHSNFIAVSMTIIKYTPQAFMNFERKSTEGFSIGLISLDFSGGVASYAQMTVQSIDQRSSSLSLN